MAAAAAGPAIANPAPANLLADIGAERLAEGMKNLASELAFLFSERGVSNEVQAWIGLGGPMSIEQFSTIDLDEKSAVQDFRRGPRRRQGRGLIGLQGPRPKKR